MTRPAADDRFYFRQLLNGRDLARHDQIAQQMVNFTYLIGDRATGECVAVDPAYAVAELVEIADADAMVITSALATHHHPDHVGGDLLGWNLQGVRDLLALDGPVRKVHCHTDDALGIMRVTGVGESDLVRHHGGDVVTVGDIGITLVHTPGHTPGSLCFLVNGALVAGDTLFLDGCGRTDLPGGDRDALYESLTQVLAKLPDGTEVYPGHMYSAAPHASLGDVKAHNYVFRPRSLDEWRMFFG